MILGKQIKNSIEIDTQCLSSYAMHYTKDPGDIKISSRRGSESRFALKIVATFRNPRYSHSLEGT